MQRHPEQSVTIEGELRVSAATVLDGTLHLVPYLERMTARPAYQRAKQKAA